MDPLEKEICLRIITKVIDTFKKININSPTNLEPFSYQNNSLSVPTWLLSAEDELKSGSTMKLCTIISKIRQDLKNCLHGLGPFLAIFCGAIYIEQVINEEIHNFPRKFRYNCSSRRNRIIRKSKGAGNNMFLQSSILMETVKDIVKSESVRSSSKDGSNIVGIRDQVKRPKAIGRKLKIPSGDEKNDKGNKKFNADDSKQKTVTQTVNRKSKKTITETASFENDKQCSASPNSNSRTLRSGVKILEVRVKGCRKDANKQSENINQYHQDTKTIVIPLQKTKTSQKIQPPKPLSPTSVETTQKNKKLRMDDYSANKCRGNVKQTANSSDKLISAKNSEDCKNNLGKKSNEFSSNVDSVMKQVNLQPEDSYTKKKYSKVHQMTQSISQNSCKIKRNTPLRGKRSIEAKEHENLTSTKKLKYSKANDVAICLGLLSPTKNSKMSDVKEERETLIESMNNKESRPNGEKNVVKNTLNSDLAIPRDQRLSDLIGEDGRKAFITELVNSFHKEIPPRGDESNTKANTTNLFEEIESIMEEKKGQIGTNFLKWNGDVSHINGQSLCSYEQESFNSGVLLENLGTSKKHPTLKSSPSVEVPADSKYANVKLSPRGNKSEKENSSSSREFTECCHKDEHWKVTTLSSDDKYESMKNIPQVVEVSCFLHACQKVLHLPFFTHFEFEWAILIPQASHLMAAIMTSLLNASPASRKEARCTALSYLEWNRRLTARISHWFFIRKRIESSTKVCDLIGVEPMFWDLIGVTRNPLSQRPFHQLTICQKVIIIKALCDHLLHVSKRIQTAIVSTPNNGRESVFLGNDSRGNLFIFFPILLRKGKGDIRIYKMEEEYSWHDTSKQIQETASEDGKASFSHFYSVECICKDRTFSLVADDIHSLDNLVEKISSYHSEDEFCVAEKRLTEIKPSTTEEEGEVDYVKARKKIDNNEEEHMKKLEDTDDSDLFPSCGHLKLALNVNLLAKNLWPYQQTLKNSRATAKSKLSAEWEEYSKDRLNAEEKKDARQDTEKSSANNGVILKNPATEASKEEHQKTPTRVSLSRKVKCKIESPLSEGAATLSRREIVAKMEEDALIGKNKASEEEKWEPNLWADEDSEDEESSAEDDLDWKGYETISNNTWVQAMNTNRKEREEETAVKEMWNNQVRAVEVAKKYTRIIVVKSVKNTKDETTSPATKVTELPKRNFKTFNIVSNSVSLSKSIVKEIYQIPTERRKTNIIQTIKQMKHDSSFGKLHFTDDFGKLCDYPIQDPQWIKIDNEKVLKTPPKHAAGSFWRVKTHEELPNYLETISEKSKRNSIQKDQENQEMFRSHQENQNGKSVCQSSREIKQRNVKKEHSKFINPENYEDILNKTSKSTIAKTMQDEETKTFKPFPLRSIVKNSKKRDLANENTEVHVK